MAAPGAPAGPGPEPSGSKRYPLITFIAVVGVLIIALIVYAVYENTGTGTTCVVSGGSCTMVEPADVGTACYCAGPGGDAPGTVHH